MVYFKLRGALPLPYAARPSGENDRAPHKQNI